MACASRRLRLHAAGCARSRSCAVELGEVGLRLLEVEAVAGAGCDELAVLLDALARQRELRAATSRDPRARPAAIAARALRHLGVGAGQLARRCSRCALPRARAALRAIRTVELVRRRVDPEQHVALLDRAGCLLRPALRSRVLSPASTIGTTYLKTRTSPTTARRRSRIRIIAVSATIGMMATMTCDVMFHGSHLNLMKISQTKNE